MKNVGVTETTCQGLLGLPILFTNLSMSLTSNIVFKSVVGLILNKHFYYHYSNACKVTYLLADNEKYCQNNNKILEAAPILLQIYFYAEKKYLQRFYFKSLTMDFGQH